MSQPADRHERKVPAGSKMTGEQEFAIQFKQAFRVLRSIAAGTFGDASLADDAVQEAAVIALQKIDQFRPGTNFTAWMAQIVRHVARNMMRKEKRRSATDLEGGENVQANDNRGDLDSSALPRLTATNVLTDGQRHFDDSVMRALREVSEIPRTCLLLRTLEGLDYTEISRILDIPEGTAMSHVHRTRLLLRQRLAHLGPPRDEKRDSTK